MLIEQSGLSRQTLQNQVALVTGAGGGIGFETAKALAWLGASVVIAEKDFEKGASASTRINQACGDDRAIFQSVDLADPAAVEQLAGMLDSNYGGVDVIINNATVTPIGAVDELTLEEWDQSYAVNLRAPVQLARLLLPGMKQRGRGVIVFVSSSGAAPFMGAYEVFKTAQVELCSTLAAELELTSISTYSIGPGLVRTETAMRAIAQVADRMGLSEAEFMEMNARHMLDAEAAGTGFAVSVVQASRYPGQEISALQALMDAGIRLPADDAGNRPNSGPAREPLTISDVVSAEAGSLEAGSLEVDNAKPGADPAPAALLAAVQQDFRSQHDGWLARNVFERQWVLRDFRKTVGQSADEFRQSLLAIKPVDRFSEREAKDICRLLSRLKVYYERQHKLLLGYERDPGRLETHSAAIRSWISDIDRLVDKLQSVPESDENRNRP